MFKHPNGLPVIVTALCILTYFSQICFGYHILDFSASNNRTRRQTPSCGNNRFTCNDGNCIALYQLCDGVVDCRDRSDEILATCQPLSTSCPEFTHVCAYGACVDSDAKCNGVQDCADNSDEVGCPETRINVCGTKFTCNNSQCINRYLLCDGAKDCTDGSDETFESCNGIACQEFSYRCAYGACVDGDAECNGEVDCADGSDESEEICGSRTGKTDPTTTTSTTTVAPRRSDGSCTLPPQPANGWYTVRQDATYTILTYMCNPNHKLYPPNYIVPICQNGKWLPGIPQCLKICSPRISESVETTCELDGIKQDCSQPMVEGTIVKMSCKHLYKQQGDTNFNPTSKCKDGSWNYGFIRCIPECGELVPEGKTFIVNGVLAKHGAFPWHVGIYKLNAESKYEQKCGGSIINTKLVLSAAHCFSTYHNGEKYDIKTYAIGAGKYYRDYYNETEEWVQIRKIKELIIPNGYKGMLSSFGSDIAFVILEQPLQLTHVVQPVCIDWNSDYESDQLINNNKGEVVGWGYTEELMPSPVLKQLTVPYIDREYCVNVVPESFVRFVTLDKFCAGYTTNMSVCDGDSGGGLVFRWQQTKKYYLRGLVSAGPRKEIMCDHTQYGAYTKISQYMEQLKRVELNTRD
ncbi:modular serine protease [Carabus blaptoides fortunei]